VERSRRRDVALAGCPKGGAARSRGTRATAAAGEQRAARTAGPVEPRARTQAGVLRRELAALDEQVAEAERLLRVADPEARPATPGSPNSTAPLVCYVKPLRTGHPAHPCAP